MMKNVNGIIAEELGLRTTQVDGVLKLLADDCTIPFIARYRKEITGNLDEVQITKIRDRFNELQELEKRRAFILSSIEEQGKLTEELKALIEAAFTLHELEDLYLPFKPKRKTRASIARDKGLEPLAKQIYEQKLSIDLRQLASKFVDVEKGVENEEQAIEGAKDIIAEWISEDRKTRELIRKLFRNEAEIISKVIKGKETEADKYRNYFNYAEPIKRCPSHRLLAIYRGENEGLLRVSVKPDEDKAIASIERIHIRNKNIFSEIVGEALKDALKRLVFPSIENEIREEFRLKAEAEAIRVFGENLRELLLAPPYGKARILAIDPGFKTGCKVVILDEKTNLLHNETIYPHPPQNERTKAANKILSLVSAYKIEVIAIGNGTASRETESFIKGIRFTSDIKVFVVNEAGASVYSASPIAREEFPDYDVTVRGAVSIGRRLVDPLSELVKIDPQSIGVGQYQHDVDSKKLKASLDEVVASCVNLVGVDVNTASRQLLKYVSGLNDTLAKNIVEYRNTTGLFTTKEQLRKVARLGPKAFEQCAGFIRIPDAANPLDRSAVHPESYPVVEKMAADLGCNVEDLIDNAALRSKIRIENYITDKVGLPTLEDILKELAKPGRDPRTQIKIFEFEDSIKTINDVKEGMLLPGIITNVTAFGAFVDLGIKVNGLIHISEIADEFVSNPLDYLRVNQKVKVRVIAVDVERKRINLSLKPSKVNNG